MRRRMRKDSKEEAAEGGEGMKERVLETERGQVGKEMTGGDVGRWVTTEIFMGLNDEWTEGGVTAATRGKGHRRVDGT